MLILFPLTVCIRIDECINIGISINVLQLQFIITLIVIDICIG